jgi:hypothetical protein
MTFTQLYLFNRLMWECAMSPKFWYELWEIQLRAYK